MEPAGADVTEDLEAAADGFVSRVVAGLKRHFGSDGEAVEKAAADNKCGVRVDVQGKMADKVDEDQGRAIRALREKKGWTIFEGCGLAG